jgi:hypothetical protein
MACLIYPFKIEVDSATLLSAIFSAVPGKLRLGWEGANRTLGKVNLGFVLVVQIGSLPVFRKKRTLPEASRAPLISAKSLRYA